MRVALDAMGGDNAPSVNVDGAIDAVRFTSGIEVILVGDEDAINARLKEKGWSGTGISVHHAPDVVSMDDPPSVAVRRKKDSSMRRAYDLVKEGRADAVVSAGNSGAMMGMALFLIGRAKGIDRPAFATFIPTLSGKPFLLLDAGANVDCSSANIFQFAHMGNDYCSKVLGIESPRVALLSIGEEEAKGNALIKESSKLLAESSLNFMGNIEPKDAFMGRADVVVCDGFVGNIFLKTSEGLAEFLMRLIKDEMMSSLLAKIGYIFLRPAFKNVKRKTAWDETGGAPLLGINGACIVCHGRSTTKAIMNAIRMASDFSAKGMDSPTNGERQSSGKENTVAAR